MMNWWTIGLLALVTLGVVQGAPDLDLVKSYPPWTEPVPNMWSAMLDIPDTNRSIHYFYVSSPNNQTDPLVLWLNGGPGCSSLYGLTKEQGPYIIDDGEKEWKRNPFPWTNLASMVFLESPAGVGFSFSDRVEWTDEQVAEDNYAALLVFFDKFPELLSRDFWIAGESYAGIYVPFLAKMILDKNPSAKVKINLKGIMVGNGITDYESFEDSRLEFLHGHQLMNLDLWEIIRKVCPIDQESPRCKYAKKQIDANLENLNIYDVYQYCYYAPEKLGGRNPFPYMSWWNKMSGRNSEEDERVPCIDTEPMEAAWNVRDLKMAVHVDPEASWKTCNFEINQKYKSNPAGSYPIYPVLMDNKIRILQYSGDTDLAVPFTSNFAVFRKMGLPIEKPWRQWTYDNQVAGYVVEYKGLTFATVKGTGHMAPQWKRGESYHMFKQFLHNEPL